MTKLPIDYSKTIIYLIRCNDLNVNHIYVGSTTNFSKRKNAHKSNCANVSSKSYNLKLYHTIRANGGWNEWKMLQIEIFNCQNKRQAEQREEYWRQQLKSELNSIKAYGGETRDAYLFLYYQENKERICQKRKNYRLHNRDKITQYYEDNKDAILGQKKQYYNAHRNKILEQKKNHYENTKNIKEVNENVVCCNCGGFYTIKNKARHFKTQKHINMELDNNNIVNHYLTI
jgi:hypothetical protein